MTTLTEFVEAHLAVTKITKAHSCETAGGPSDLSPMMIWLDADDKTNLALVDMKGNLLDYMPKVLSLVAKQNPKYIIYVVEGFSKSVSNEAELEEFTKTHKPGDLAKLHKELGPLAGLEEIIALHALDTESGEQVQGIARYTYNDKGQPVFANSYVQELPSDLFDRANMSIIFDSFHKFMVSHRGMN